MKGIAIGDGISLNLVLQRSLEQRFIMMVYMKVPGIQEDSWIWKIYISR